MSQTVLDTISAISAVMSVPVPPGPLESIEMIEAKQGELEEHINNAGQSIELLVMYKNKHHRSVSADGHKMLTNIERTFMMLNILGLQFRSSLDIAKRTNTPEANRTIAIIYLAIKEFQKHLNLQIKEAGQVLFA